MANGLWQKLENRHASNVANRENRDNNSSLLYQVLMAGNNKGNNNSFASNTEQASQGFNGFAKLANTLKGSNSDSSNGISSFNIGSLGNLDSLGNLGAIGNAAGSLTGGSSSLPTTLGGASSGSAITDAISGAGGSGSAITDAINSNVGGSAASNAGGFLSKFKGGGSGGGTLGIDQGSQAEPLENRDRMGGSGCVQVFDLISGRCEGTLQYPSPQGPSGGDL